MTLKLIGKILAIIGAFGLFLVVALGLAYIGWYNLKWSTDTQTIFVGSDICIVSHDMTLVSEGKLQVYKEWYSYNPMLPHVKTERGSYNKAMHTLWVSYPNRSCVAVGPMGKVYNRVGPHLASENEDD